MGWIIEYTDEANKDLLGLDNSQRRQVLQAIQRVSINPLPTSEGGYGKPLGNHISSFLAGYLKIKLKKSGLRVIYHLIKTNNIMRIIIISVRDADFVYKNAEKRIMK